MNDTTKTAAATFYTGTVLAGAAVGRNSDLKGLLTHAALAEGELTVGRLRRAEGEALCDKALNMVDVYGGEPGVTGVTCPKCLAVLARMGVQ